MEKVKLNQSQADAIEYLLKERTAESIVREKANPLTGAKIYVGESDHIIFTETNLDTIIRALYIGYEVEPEFNVGDWVVPNSKNYLGHYHPQKITNVDDIKTHIRHLLEDGLWSGETQIRHATPEEIAEEKERRWWERHGRDVWELKINDIVHSKVTKTYDEVVFVFRNGSVNLKSTTPNDFNQYHTDTIPKREIKNHNFKVICFAEDRQDVKE